MDVPAEAESTNSSSFRLSGLLGSARIGPTSHPQWIGRGPLAALRGLGEAHTAEGTFQWVWGLTC